MGENITVFFTENGTPKTGLSPTLTAWNLAGSVQLNAVAMTEIAGGWYYYTWGAYDDATDYVFRADGGAGLSDSDRYPFASNAIAREVYVSETAIRGTDSDDLKALSDQLDTLPTAAGVADAVWDETAADHVGAGSMGALLDFLWNIEGGRWEIDTATNQMVFYEADNVTEVARFNLLDSAGVAASEDVYERTRV